MRHLFSFYSLLAIRREWVSFYIETISVYHDLILFLFKVLFHHLEHHATNETSLELVFHSIRHWIDEQGISVITLKSFVYFIQTMNIYIFNGLRVLISKRCSNNGLVCVLELLDFGFDPEEAIGEE